MFAASRYLAIFVIVLSAGNKEVMSKPVQYNLQTDAESVDYFTDTDFTILNIYDWLYLIFNEDDDGDVKESQETYLICRNCTIIVQQNNTVSQKDSEISGTPPRTELNSVHKKTANIQMVDNTKTETNTMRNPDRESTKRGATNMEISEIEQTSTTLTTAYQEG